MQYKTVDNEYLKNKILNEEYTRLLIKKTGRVQANRLKKGDKVKTYFYDDSAQIRTKQEVIEQDEMVLIVKKINNKEYNTILTPLAFYKSYTKTIHGDYMPLIDHFNGYTVDENIEFVNTWGQTMSMCPGDLIVPRDARLESFYGIFKYNFEDNYSVVGDQNIVSDPTMHCNKNVFKIN